jgi:protein phosphatase
MRLRVGARTDVGRVRKGNEDSYSAEEPLFAVADGMGGHQGGEVASSVALEVLGTGEGTLEELVREANDEVFRRAAKDPGLSGMGTTLTALRHEGTVLRLAHVGDSRAYLLRDETIQRLTKDHTVVERLVDEGRLTAEEAEIHPQRSILTRALGVDQAVQVDQGAIEPRVGDRLLLCSDGLTGMVDEAGITRILTEHAEPQQAADALVEAANEAGGQDNITAVVIDVLDGSSEVPAAVGAKAPPVARRTEAARPVDRRRIPRGLVWLAVVLVVVAGALWAVKSMWVDNQFYVGESNGVVAVYRGIPAAPLGIDLSTPVKEYPDLPAGEVTAFPEYQALPDGITASSEEDARSIVEEMRAALEAAQPAEGPG